MGGEEEVMTTQLCPIYVEDLGWFIKGHGHADQDVAGAVAGETGEDLKILMASEITEVWMYQVPNQHGYDTWWTLAKDGARGAGRWTRLVSGE